MIRQFLCSKKGASAIEFALIAPIFLIMLMGGLEAGRFVMIMNKLQSAGFSLASIVSQTQPANAMNACDTLRLNQQVLTNITSGMNTLMEPHADGDDASRVIVTSLMRDNGAMRIVWQHSQGQLQGANSEITGAPGGNAGFTDPAVTAETGALTEGENMLVLEAFFRYEPIFPRIFGAVSDTFTPRTLAKRVYFYNRLGKAIYLPPNFPVAGEIPCGNGGGGNT